MKIMTLLSLLSLSFYGWAQVPTAQVGSEGILENPSRVCTLEITDAKNAHNLNTVPSYTLGEYLHLTLVSNCNLYVYLFNIDSNNVVNALPNARGELVGQGRLIANQQLRLPNNSEGYRLSGTTGQESIFVVGTVVPLDANGISQFASIIESALPYYHQNTVQSLPLQLVGIQANGWTTGVMRYALSQPNLLGNPSPSNTLAHPIEQPSTATVATPIASLNSLQLPEHVIGTNPSTTATKHVAVTQLEANMQPLDPQMAAQYPNQAIVRITTASGATVLIENPTTNQSYSMTETPTVSGDFTAAFPAGEYSVRVSHPRYLSQVGYLTTVVGHLTTLNMLLQPNAQPTLLVPIAQPLAQPQDTTAQQYATVNILTTPGATVQIVNHGIIPESSTTQGSFSALVLPGEYVVNVSKAGHLSQTANFTAIASHVSNIDMLLQQE